MRLNPHRFRIHPVLNSIGRIVWPWRRLSPGLKYVTGAIASGALLGAIIAVAAGLLGGGLSNATAALRASGQAIASAAQQLSIAKTLAEVRQATQGTDETTRNLSNALGELADAASSDPKAILVRDALHAYMVISIAVADLGDLEERALAAEWRATRKKIREGSALLEEATPRLSQRFPGENLAPPVSPLETAVARLDTLLLRINRKLRRWRHRISNLRRIRRQELGILRSYARSVRGQLQQYAVLREQFQEWVAQVEAGEVTFTEAYSFLDDAATRRAGVAQGLRGIDSPTSLATAHGQLLSIVGAAVEAVRAAARGIVEYQFDFYGDYASYNETPGWREFRDTSERISREYGSARAGWETRLRIREKEIRNRKLPPKPSI